GLQIAVQHATGVSMVDRVRQIHQHVERALYRKPLDPPEPGAQVLALDVLHRQVRTARREDTKIVALNDRRLRQPLDDPRLAPEARHEFAVAREKRVEDLERLAPATPHALDEVHLAHTPLPELFEDSILRF